MKNVRLKVPRRPSHRPMSLLYRHQCARSTNRMKRPRRGRLPSVCCCTAAAVAPGEGPVPVMLPWPHSYVWLCRCDGAGFHPSDERVSVYGGLFQPYSLRDQRAQRPARECNVSAVRTRPVCSCQSTPPPFRVAQFGVCWTVHGQRRTVSDALRSALCCGVRLTFPFLPSDGAP